MKKAFALVLVLIAVVFEVSALDEYGIPRSSFRFYYDYGGGWAGAKYCGTTKNLTAQEVHNNRWQSSIARYNNGEISYPESFGGKLSKRQSALAWNALGQYDYEPGEIYSVGFYEGSDFNHYYGITCQINLDDTFSWNGFSYYMQ